MSFGMLRESESPWVNSATLSPRTRTSARTWSEVEMVTGLRTVIYHVTDLEQAKRWYADAFGIQPYFDQAFYVGFNIGGFELGLDPDNTVAGPGPGGAVAFWKVDNIEKASEHFLATGATTKAAVQDVGG